MRYKTRGFSIVNDHPPVSPEGEAVPLDLQGAFARLDTIHQAISPAFQQLQEQCEDLSCDWSTREQPFWLRTLDILKELHAGVSLLTDVGQDVMNDPGCLIEMRYAWMLNMHHILSETDKVGIEVTSYTPVCASKSKSRLQRRRRISEALKRLAKAAEELLSMIGPSGRRQFLKQLNQDQREAVPSRSRPRASRRVRERRRRERGTRI